MTWTMKTHALHNLQRATIQLGIVALIAGCAGTSAERKAANIKAATVVSGTNFVAALQSAVATDRNKVGDEISLRTLEPIAVNGVTLVPAGATVNGQVTHVEDAGRIKGAAELTLRFTELVTPDGKRYTIACEPFRVVGKSDGTQSAELISGGAVGGAIVGAILGGGKGALEGAAAGGILGTGVAVVTKGNQIVLPAGQQLRVTLTEPVLVKVKVA
jgi:hypothetical protein